MAFNNSNGLEGLDGLQDEELQRAQEEFHRYLDETWPQEAVPTDPYSFLEFDAVGADDTSPAVGFPTAASLTATAKSGAASLPPLTQSTFASQVRSPWETLLRFPDPNFNLGVDLEPPSAFEVKLAPDAAFKLPLRIREQPSSSLFNPLTSHMHPAKAHESQRGFKRKETSRVDFQGDSTVGGIDQGADDKVRPLVNHINPTSTAWLAPNQELLRHAGYDREMKRRLMSAPQSNSRPQPKSQSGKASPDRTDALNQTEISFEDFSWSDADNDNADEDSVDGW